MSFKAGFVKIALIMADEALNEAKFTPHEYVPGQHARENAETGQGKQVNVRTKGVRNENREFSQANKTKYDTSRFGRRQHVS